ncbi:MAG: hypothetical protein KF819_23125 [Labilithrix sp.]|nr:hypothetical protein [Labilithrix sp.]
MRTLLALALAASMFVLAACPTPQLPKGPPPEYEDPPPPSWLAEAGADVTPATAPPPVP